MADIVHYIHYRHDLETGAPGEQPTKTGCGIPVKDGQAFAPDGSAIGLTTVPHSATCHGCIYQMSDEAKSEAASKGGHQNAPAGLVSPPFDPGNPDNK
jgi:hypothetical protein